MPVRDVVTLSAQRTPIGKYGGSFRDVHPAELGAIAARAAVEHAGITPDDVDEVGDFDIVELNEAFAAQVLAVLREVPIAPERLNVNGGMGMAMAIERCA
jgi:acetyl-CoA C-acetyltransferase